MKKLLCILGILGWIISKAAAQVTVEVTMDQAEFLPSESLPVAVKITNRSGQRLHFGAEGNWLTFNVESVDGFVVIKNADVPVTGEFDLESSQMAIKRVDLAPSFTLIKTGRYKIVATLRIKDWYAQETSAPEFFDIINGITLWSQNFGMPMIGSATNRMPEVRKYSLIKANYLISQLRLYVQVSDPVDAEIYKVTAIGPLVSFSEPEAQVDQFGILHALYQSGGSTFSYSIVGPDGKVISRDLYDYVNSRPRLGINTQGDVVVVGGVRRLNDEEMPKVKMPNEVHIPARP